MREDGSPEDHAEGRPAPLTDADAATGGRLGALARAATPPIVAFVVILAAWEFFVSASDVDPTLFVPASRVLPSIPEVLADELYVESLIETLRLLGIGFAISAVLGIGSGLILGRVRLLDRALTPWANGLYAAPLPALIPIITAAVGYRLTAKLFVVVIIGVFPILINTFQGVVETDRELIEVARSFRSGELQIWRNVVLPSALPYILVGLRLGVVRCLIGTVVAEFYTSPGGLGYMIIIFSRRFDMASMLVPVLTLTTLGLVLVGAIALLERRITPWQQRN